MTIRSGGLEYLRWIGGGYSDEALARALCDNAPRVVRYLGERAGVEWALFRNYPDYFWPMADGSVEEGRYLEVRPFRGEALGSWQGRTRKGVAWTLTNAEVQSAASPALGAQRARSDERTMGAGLGAYLVKAAVTRGTRILCEFVVDRLLSEGDRVVGVVGRHDGRPASVRARKGVLIATSGYDWSRQFVSRFDARPGGATRTQPAVAGDHLRWAGMLGAQVASMTARPQWVGLSFRSPDECDEEGIPLWQNVGFRLPHSVLVNRHGRRFCDESWGPSYVAALAHADIDRPGLVNQPFWAVFDSRHRARYRVGFSAPGDPLPAVVVSAPTLRALGASMGVDPAGLELQVERFNRFADQGEDPDFHRGERAQARANGDKNAAHPNLGSVAEPPFFAVKMEACSIGIPTAGLVSDRHGRVPRFGTTNRSKDFMGPETPWPCSDWVWGTTVESAIREGWCSPSSPPATPRKIRRFDRPINIQFN